MWIKVDHEGLNQAKTSSVKPIDSLPFFLKHCQLLVEFGDGLLDFDIFGHIAIEDKNFASFLELSVSKLEYHHSVLVVTNLLNRGPFQAELGELDSLLLGSCDTKLLYLNEASNEMGHEG